VQGSVTVHFDLTTQAGGRPTEVFALLMSRQRAPNQASLPMYRGAQILPKRLRPWQPTQPGDVSAPGSGDGQFLSGVRRSSHLSRS
jgi:hypothetical protein